MTETSTQVERQRAYGASVTYLTAREAGFDFLRDSIALHPESLRHRQLHFAIVDEADFLLIDEARVPMVIAGNEGEATRPDIEKLDSLVAPMKVEVHFHVDHESRNAWFTDEGLRFLERKLALGSLFLRRNRSLMAAAHTVLLARTLLVRDVDYILGIGGIELVDPFTGRTALRRRWPDGIHSAVEAREGLSPAREGAVLGSIAVQHFMMQYQRISGMTATARDSAKEFFAAYGLEVVVIPPHRRCIRKDEPDRVFTSHGKKLQALVQEIQRQHQRERPVLVGTSSVRESEELALHLEKRGIHCDVLNARSPAREAVVIAKAGSAGAVTISTNMAGRGGDIPLGGGDPEAERKVRALGGLYVIGTCRHESRRIDDQLRGRAGRQGDPGGSCFFLSLEDDLISRFHVRLSWDPDQNRNRSGLPRAANLEIAHAQRVIEGKLMKVRHTLREYSSIMEVQRRRFQEFRRKVLIRGEARLFLKETAEMYLIQMDEEAIPHEVLTRIVLFHIDRLWAIHLERVRDLREGVHLVRLGGHQPLQAYETALAKAFFRTWRRLEGAILRDGMAFNASGRAPRSGRPRGPASTWTYLINDDPFTDWKLGLISGGNLGTAAMTPLVLLANLPLVLVVFLIRKFKRWRGGGNGKE